MVQPGHSRQSEASVAAAWKTALAEIPSVFGRLVYLHSLAHEQDRVIGHTHHQVFISWLSMGLAEQIRDLRQYFESTPGTRLPDYRRLIPTNAREVERQLYLTDMETVLELLRVDSVAQVFTA